jgi:hypothetical protein
MTLDFGLSRRNGGKSRKLGIARGDGGFRLAGMASDYGVASGAGCWKHDSNRFHFRKRPGYPMVQACP